jgi:hypothetical protein
MPARLVELAERLSFTSTRLAEAHGRPLCPWAPETRHLIDAEADALVAKTYGLSLSDYETVLDHFALLKRVEESDENIGEYRSKRLRLEAFEDLRG